MEDVLDVYTQERDEKRPLECMDECPKQLTGETRVSLPVQPGQPACFDTEYVQEAGAWNRRGNEQACKINRRFTTADARIKLKRLYPQFE
jgi:hypothetical protein